MTSDSESEEDHNELELSWDRKEPVMLDMEERMMKEEDIYDIITELSLPVSSVVLISGLHKICTTTRIAY